MRHEVPASPRDSAPPHPGYCSLFVVHRQLLALHEFLQRVDLQRRMHGPHQWLPRDEDDRHHVLVVVAVHLQDMRSARDVVVGEEHRVTIGRAFRHLLDAKRSAGASSVLDDDLLSDRARYELVVNSVDKDRIRGYISAPKDKLTTGAPVLRLQ